MTGDYNGRLGELNWVPILFPGQQPADRESAALTVLTIVLIRDAGLTTDFRRHNLVTRRQQLPCPRGRARLNLAKLAYSDTFIDRLSETVLDVGNTTLDSAALSCARPQQIVTTSYCFREPSVSSSKLITKTTLSVSNSARLFVTNI